VRLVLGTRSRQPGRGVVVLGIALASIGGAGPARLGAPARGPNPYFTAPFTVETGRYTFGQDPSFAPDGRVLSNERDGSGTEQVYVSKLDGSTIRCLTCGQPGPNGFPQERPQGDWILFCSWRGSPVTFGAPCLGGVGTDLYVMRPDGSDVTRLTAPGLPFEPSGVPFDNYHPAWSPDGRHLVWTHVGFADLAAGGTQWTMLVADFAPRRGRTPVLTNLRVVGPATDTGYETQVWAPDGSGFLYTAMGQDGAGWLNLELYFLRLAGPGAAPGRPLVTHLTDGNTGWDEQAVFTPDMRDVIWMSSRGSPTWYQTFVTAAQQLGFRPPLQNETFGPMFVLAISDPGFHTDLYELDRATGAIRRLTNLNRVVPEFYFDPSGRRLLWSEGGHAVTRVGRFALSAVPRRVGPTVRRDAAWAGAPRRGHASAPASVGPSTTNAPGPLPASITEGVGVLQAQLGELARRLQGLPQGPSCCRATPTPSG
jgi:hypothetical protein